MKNRFELFVCRREDKTAGETLLKRAALAYGVSEQDLANSRLLRTDAGKPYFEGLDIHFNISHSSDVWGCLVGPRRCGLDIQYIRPCNFKKIAGRFFSPAERRYIDSQGLEGFFEIWTRREAFGKYTGEGFFGDFDGMAGDDGPAGEVDGAALIPLDLGSDLKCICCIPKPAAGAKIDIRYDF